MDAAFTLSFPVRSYECDGYGHVNHATYLHYMQEAAFCAAEAAGFGVNTLREMGFVWLAREHDIEFLRPFAYGDTVTIKTWVADFRRVRSLRVYELYNRDELAARATTDWVYVDTITRRPTTVPADMIKAFSPHTSTPEARRTRFPQPAAPPAERFPQQRRVEWRDIDRQQHVNNAVYLAYMENCIISACERLGWPVARMTAEGFAIFARRYQIEYQAAAVLGEELEVTTWFSDVRRATAIRHYAITRLGDGALMARGRALWVWVNPETGQPVRIPAHFLADFAENASPSAS